MNNMKKAIALIIFTVFTEQLFAKDDLEVVPLVKVIVMPEKYHGKRVSVVGVYKFNLDSSTLYLTKEHYTSDLFDSSVSVELPNNFKLESIETLSELNGQYVQIDAVFDAVEKGYMGMNQGTLKSVKKIQFYD